MRALLLIVCSLCSALAFSQNYAIGHRTITFADPARTGGFGSGGGPGRQIQTEVYYPATTAGDNVAITGSNYPVVVFGHGFVMAWDAYQNVWEDLVPLGYIVCFPRTEGGIPPNHGDFGLDLAFVAEAMQTRSQTDASFFFYQKTAPTTALMGHSMGGGAAHLAAANNSNITCIATFAPAETNPSAAAAAVNIKVPALVVAGANDCVTPLADHAGLIYNGIGSKCKTLVTLTGASHCQFAESNFNCNFGEATCSPGPAISRAQQHVTQANYYVSFLNKYLKGICNTATNFDQVITNGVGATAIQQTCMPQAGNNSAPCPGTTVNLGSTLMDGYTFQWTSVPAGYTSTLPTPQASPNVTTTYILTYTNLQSNCAVVDSVTVNIPISAATAGNDATICPGDSVQLGAAPLSYTYSWASNPTGFISNLAQTYVLPATTTTYYLTVTDGTCTFTDTATVTVSPGALATITPSGPLTFCDNVPTTLTANSGFANYLWLPGGQTSQSIPVTQSGTYSVIVSNNAQCIDTSDVVAITVNPAPTPQIVANGPTAFCSNESVTLSTDTGYTSYIWGPVLSITNQLQVNQSGSYIVLVSAANGCTGSDTIAITVFPAPTVTITLQNDTLFANGNAGTGSYEWTFNGTQTSSPYIVPTADGNYVVEYTDTNGCTATATYPFIGNTIIAIDANRFSIYPNPATNKVYLATGGNSPINYALYNYAGQLIQPMQKGLSNPVEIDLNGLKTGMYWLKIEQNGSVFYKKVVKL